MSQQRIKSHHPGKYASPSPSSTAMVEAGVLPRSSIVHWGEHEETNNVAPMFHLGMSLSLLCSALPFSAPP